jgi:hypothetical protein
VSIDQVIEVEMRQLQRVINSFLVLVVAIGSLGLSLEWLAVRAQGEEFTPLPQPVEGPLDEATIKQIDLKALPILPDLTANAGYLRAIHREGLKYALNPDVFTKVGDCMTASESFLIPISTRDYALDRYTALQPMIDRFSKVVFRDGLNSFSNPSLAAASGFNAASVLEALWADPKLCGVEETPLACEYRIARPSIAIVLFGTNDLKSLTPSQFDFYLRSVLVQTVNAGIVPIMSTFPNQPGLIEQSIFFNQITVKIAQDYNLPLINLWLAFDPLPNQGIDPKEPTHMTKPPSGKVASFAEADLQGGHNVHNLLTLQALDLVVKMLDSDN